MMKSKVVAKGRTLVLGFAVAFSVLLLLSAFSAETGLASIQLQGQVDSPLSLGVADLQSMPRVKVQVRDHDGNEAVYEGSALWDLVNRAKPRLGEKPNSAIARGWLVVRAADNYQAVFALAEINPEFTDNKIILADERDGKPLGNKQGPFEIIVPGDKIHARWVRQVIALDIVVPDGEIKK